MKSIIDKILRPAIFSTLLLLCGCQGWLEVEPIDKDLEKTVYSNQVQINAAHNGLYLRLGSNSLYGSNLTTTTVEQLAQQYAWPVTGQGITTGTTLQYYLMTYDYEETLVKTNFSAIWSQAYTTILDINMFINRLSITHDVISQEKKDLLLGEAYALRAFVHFDLLRLFGPVFSQTPEAPAIPYYTSPRIAKKEILPANAVVNKVMADVEMALSLLENDPVLINGVSSSGDNMENDFYYNNYRSMRMNYHAVSVFKARVMHYMGDDALTEGYVRSILSAVNNTFPWVTQEKVTDMDAPDRVFYPEVLFGIHSENMYSNWRSYFSGEITDPFRLFLMSEYNLKYAFGVASLPGYQDFRFKNLTAYLRTPGYYSSIKYQKSTEANNNDNFQPLMRKSELYYILAECTSDPQWLITVKENRGASLQVITNLDEELRKEYMVEFMGEGQLFYFYKRRNEARLRDGSATTEDKYVDMSYSKYILPIPDSEVNN